MTFGASGKREGIRLIRPGRGSLEQAIIYLHCDEFIEVTPGAIRIRSVSSIRTSGKREARKMEAA